LNGWLLAQNGSLTASFKTAAMADHRSPPAANSTIKFYSAAVICCSAQHSTIGFNSSKSLLCH